MVSACAFKQIEKVFIQRLYTASIHTNIHTNIGWVLRACQSAFTLKFFSQTLKKNKINQKSKETKGWIQTLVNKKVQKPPASSWKVKKTKTNKSESMHTYRSLGNGFCSKHIWFTLHLDKLFSCFFLLFLVFLLLFLGILHTTGSRGWNVMKKNHCCCAIELL